MKICKTYRFEAAHHLPGYDGPCSQPHGHSYILEVEVSGPVVNRPGKSDDQMVLDFKILDRVVMPLVEMLDHTDLNESTKTLGVRRTTAECLVRRLAARISLDLSQYIAPSMGYALQLPIQLHRLRLWETTKAWTEWERGA